MDGTTPFEFKPQSREDTYRWIGTTLEQLRYKTLGKADRGTVKAFLEKVSGLSRAQVTRLISQHRKHGRVRGRRGPPRMPFPGAIPPRISVCLRKWILCMAPSRGRLPGSCVNGPLSSTRTNVMSDWRRSPTAICTTICECSHIRGTRLSSTGADHPIKLGIYYRGESGTLPIVTPCIINSPFHGIPQLFSIG